MPLEILYDTRDLTATEVQFFHQDRTAHPDKELGTNMPLEKKLPWDYTITRIVVEVPPRVASSTTAKDTAVLDPYINLVRGIIEIQIGTERFHYLPLAPALHNTVTVSDVEYTLATAADGSYAAASIAQTQRYGLEYPLTIPAGMIFTFKLRFVTAPGISNVRVIMYGERP